MLMSKQKMESAINETGNAPYRVALVEDQAEMRKDWSQLINSLKDFTCVISCSSAEEALRDIPAIKPDVILMDIFLLRMSGIECTARLKTLLPDSQILILTAVEDEELVFMALEAGADGYLLKRTRPSDLRLALLDVLHGGAPMTSQVARHLVQYFRRKRTILDKEPHLSAREEEVLVLLSRGYSNKEIAQRLGLSIETIAGYLKIVYKKLRVRSRTEAVAKYLTAKSP